MDSKEVKTGSKEVPTDFISAKEYIEKFKVYDAEFRKYVMSRYFPNKPVVQGNQIEFKMKIAGQAITATRLPPTQPYLDSATFDAVISNESGSAEETPTTGTSKGKSLAQGN